MTSHPYIDRVKAADADAEMAWNYTRDHLKDGTHDDIVELALIAIAAELRAQRISRRTGAGQT